MMMMMTVFDKYQLRLRNKFPVMTLKDNLML
jgi:hypothetical protein